MRGRRTSPIGGRLAAGQQRWPCRRGVVRRCRPACGRWGRRSRMRWCISAVICLRSLVNALQCRRGGPGWAPPTAPRMGLPVPTPGCRGRTRGPATRTSSRCLAGSGPVVGLVTCSSRCFQASATSAGRSRLSMPGWWCLDVGPERAGQGADELAERAVVHGGSALVEVADQHVADGLAGDSVSVDQFGGGSLPSSQGWPQRLGLCAATPTSRSRSQAPWMPIVRLPVVVAGRQARSSMEVLGDQGGRGLFRCAARSSTGW